MFAATVRWEYRTNHVDPVMRFSCVSDLDEYRELVGDPTSSLVWYFQPVGRLNASSDAAFELMQLTVDGKPRPIRRTERAAAQTFTVATIKATGERARRYTAPSPTRTESWCNAMATRSTCTLAD